MAYGRWKTRADGTPIVFRTKHYVVLEKALASCYAKHPENAKAITEVALELAQTFADDNPGFNASKFVGAIMMYMAPVDLSPVALVRANRIKQTDEVVVPTESENAEDEDGEGA